MSSLSHAPAQPSSPWTASAPPSKLHRHHSARHDPREPGPRTHLQGGPPTPPPLTLPYRWTHTTRTSQGVTVGLMLQMKKQAQRGHSANEWQSQDPEPDGFQNPNPTCDSFFFFFSFRAHRWAGRILVPQPVIEPRGPQGSESSES